jgi:hypothetical protein
LLIAEARTSSAGLVSDAAIAEFLMSPSAASAALLISTLTTAESANSRLA